MIKLVLTDGIGVSVPDFSSCTRWEDVRCEITVTPVGKNKTFEFVGCCISEFRNKEYMSFFNSYKLGNEYYILKTSFQTLDEPPSHIVYKITTIDLDNFTFGFRGFREDAGSILGQLTLTQTRGYRGDRHHL
jgi:hypothetical protein